MNRFRRLLPLTLCAGLAVAGLGCSADPRAPVRFNASSSSKRPEKMTPADLQQFVSANAAIAGADSAVGQTTLPSAPIAKEPEPARQTPAIIVTNPSIVLPSMTVTVPTNRSRPSTAVISIPNIRSSAPRETEQEARYDALQVAALKLNTKLQQLDSPIGTTISPNRVWNEFVVRDSGRPVPLTADEITALGQSKAGANRTYYEIDVELNDQQIRSLRSESRIRFLAPFMVAGLVLAAIGHLVLRVGGVVARKIA